MIVRGAMLAVLLAALVVAAAIERRRRAQAIAEAYAAAYRLSPEYQRAVEDLARSLASIGNAMIPSIRAVAAAFSDVAPVMRQVSFAMAAFGEAFYVVDEDGVPVEFLGPEVGR